MGGILGSLGIDPFYLFGYSICAASGNYRITMSGL